MGNTEFVLLIIILITALSYTLLIVSLTRGWLRLKQFGLKENFSTFISVVVPVRNEAHMLENLINLLESQQYPIEFHEFILVNDHSTDQSPEILNKINSTDRFKVFHLPDASSGKKAAIRYGIEHASGTLITTLDADCMPGPNWLASIASCYEESKFKMIAGPVSVYKPRGYLASFQALELLSLVASGGGAIGLKKPIMCNGANLSYEKKVFKEVGGFKGNERIPGGDDIFMMEKVNRYYPKGSIGFNTLPEGMVYTPAASTLKGFLNQRFRWVAKSKAYKDAFLITSALIVLLFNLCLLAALVFAFISLPGLLIFGGLFLLKCLIDFPILWKAVKFSGQTRLFGNYISFQFIYFIFASLSGVLGNVFSFSWKGRRK
ncbi:MAG: glycosyltransferase [Bacteroidales bacterium]|jgi:cellulose synthase/poly-beta-1,6-N-acetylglucosamine synthase-like glycosyltransferase|nr:glycosyltransferase [Bacteroidales bacterium]